MVFYTGLARLARDAGLVVREVNGWKSRTLGTRPNGMAGARGCLWHHTATNASAVKSRNNPTLNYMVNGLGYPLANYGLAWDGSIDVIAAGAAAHAGKGRYGSRIPQDRGNDYLLGVEVEGTVGLTWSDAQLESAARLGHAMNKEWGSSFLQIGHLEYAPTRKVDPSGIPGGMPALRKAIARGYWKNKNWKPGGKVTTGSSNSKPKPAAKPKPKPSKPAAPKNVRTDAWLRKHLPRITSGTTNNSVSHLVGLYQRQQIAPYRLVHDQHWGKKTDDHYRWVHALQVELNKWKGTKIPITKTWDKTTRDRVIEWQKRNMGGAYKGTVADGVVGPLTIKPLGLRPYPS